MGRFYNEVVTAKDFPYKEDFELEALSLDEAQEIMGVDFDTDD